MIIIIFFFLIIFYILILYWNFEWIFEFGPYVAETFAFLSFRFCAFLNLIIIISIKENKKKLILCQRNEQNFYSRKVFKKVNLVRVFPLITNLASFFNNKFFFKFRSVRLQKFLCFFIYPVFCSQWTLNICPIRYAAYWTTSF